VAVLNGKVFELLAAIILISPLTILSSVLPSDSLESDYDVIIAGASSGGVSAAIQASRMGAKVALIEETDWIGGQMTAAGVTSMDYTTDIIPTLGIYKEFLQAIVDYYKRVDANKSVYTCYLCTQFAFEPNIGQQALFNLISSTRQTTNPETGFHPVLHLSLYTKVSSVSIAADGKTVTGVTVQIAQPNSNIQAKNISCRILIDASECGDVIHLTPARYMIGKYITHGDCSQDTNVFIQDITYAAIIRKYTDSFSNSFLQLNQKPNPKTSYCNDSFPSYLSYDSITTRFARLVNDSVPQNSDGNPRRWRWHTSYRAMPSSQDKNNYCGIHPNSDTNITKTGVNFANDYPSTTPYLQVNADPKQPKLSVRYLYDRDYRKTKNSEAKLKTLQFLYYAQVESGKADWSVDTSCHYNTPFNLSNMDTSVLPDTFRQIASHFPVIPYVRESMRLVGMHVLKGMEINRHNRNPSSFIHSLSLGCYPMDVHNANSPSDMESYDSSLTQADKDKPGLFQIPYESFIPELVDGFLVAEKNLSVSRLASASIRVQPTTMLTGQAVGAIAGCAIRAKVQPRQLNPMVIQKAILDSKSKISPFVFNDVPLTSEYYSYVELARCYNLFVGYGDGTFGPSYPLLRKYAADVIVNAFGLTSQMPPRPTFLDVPQNDPYWQYVEVLYAQGITSGCSSDSMVFCPDNSITRAQFAIFLTGAMGLNISSAPQQPFFSDVDATHWAFNYFQVLAQQGIIASTDTYIHPDDVLTRGEAAKWLITALLKSGPNASKFRDVPRSNEYWSYIELASNAGLFGGYGDGTFGPSHPLLRKYAADVIVNGFCLRSHIPLRPTFVDVPKTDPSWHDVEVLYAKGITSGCSSNPMMFCPDSSITRSQFAIFMTGAMGLEINNVPQQPFFSDVDITHWAFNYFQVLAQQGIIASTDTYIHPDDVLTRGEAAKWMITALIKSNRLQK